MAELKVGEVVVLMSGGPEMTVEVGPDDKDQVVCTWFDGDKRLKGVFPVAALHYPY
jgi:uncharacterized protein YodC (DUF2158 family)